MDSLYSITHPSRIHDIKFCNTIDKQSEVLLVGAEDCKVSVYGISKSSQPPFIVAEMVGHTNRFVHVSSGPKTFSTDISSTESRPFKPLKLLFPQNRADPIPPLLAQFPLTVSSMFMTSQTYQNSQKAQRGRHQHQHQKKLRL